MGISRFPFWALHFLATAYSCPLETAHFATSTPLEVIQVAPFPCLKGKKTLDFEHKSG
jgi:hypothetical protein